MPEPTRAEPRFAAHAHAGARAVRRVVGAALAVRKSGLIRPRPRARLVHGILLSLAFASLAAPVLTAHGWVPAQVEMTASAPAPITVRVPLFLGRTIQDVELSGGSIVVARGERIDNPAVLDLVRERQPTGWGVYVTYGAGLFLAAMLFTAQLRRSHKGRLLRTQLVLLALILVGAVGACALLLVSAVSVLALPIAALSILVALAVDLGSALATALMSALVLGALTPFDPGVICVLGVQGAAAALAIGERPRGRVGRLRVLGAGLLGGLGAALCYFLIYYLSHNRAPLAELESPLRSAWIAAGAAGLVGGVLAVAALPLFQRALGDVPLSTLVELEDLSNPLLKQIAEKSPGTWQHSLAMANMAEIAANTIGASGRLVRVGAYYHDLGKSLQPKYFIENLAGGEGSPHDALSPNVSCDAIFAHVTEGVRVARKHGLHERIIDFMHMHHGDGLLEYFWAKCLEQGNPDGLTQDDFRYPGVKPHSKETAILAICDAVEAASRTLRNPDHQAIENLVQRIVYGKLHLGQLDQSGLTVADLRKISNSLMETIKHAHHGRIEYPWQREKRAAEAAAAAAAVKANGHAPDGGRPTASGNGAPHGEGSEYVTQLARPPRAEEAGAPASDTQRLLNEPRLDSLDVPRPTWRGRSGPVRPPTASAAIELAATEPVSSPTEQVPLTRSPTAAEVAAATAPDAPSGRGAPGRRPATPVPAARAPAGATAGATGGATARVTPGQGDDDAASRNQGASSRGAEESAAMRTRSADPTEPAPPPVLTPPRAHDSISHALSDALQDSDHPAPTVRGVDVDFDLGPRVARDGRGDVIASDAGAARTGHAGAGEADRDPQTEWEAALRRVALAGVQGALDRPPPRSSDGRSGGAQGRPGGVDPPGGAPAADPPPLARGTAPTRGTAHVIRRPDTDPALEITVQRRVPMPLEAVTEGDGSDPDAPTEPRVRIPIEGLDGDS